MCCRNGTLAKMSATPSRFVTWHHIHAQRRQGPLYSNHNYLASIAPQGWLLLSKRKRWIFVSVGYVYFIFAKKLQYHTILLPYTLSALLYDTISSIASCCVHFHHKHFCITSITNIYKVIGHNLSLAESWVSNYLLLLHSCSSIWGNPIF